MTDQDKIIRTLLTLGGYLLKTGNRITDRYGLTQQQFVLLKEITDKQEIRQKDLVCELLCEKSNVSKTAKKLQQAGLIRITRPSSDLRTTLLSPTDKGRQTCSACMDELRQWNRDFLDELDAAEQEQTLKVLGRLLSLVKP